MNSKNNNHNHSQPKISVIIGVLNMRESIEKTILSVIQQSYPHFELIIMDGGSTDGTIDIIKHYAEHITYWQSQPDKGHPDACNKALQYATGDLIGFLNADDFYQSNILQKTADCFRQHPHADVISCGTRVIERDASGNERMLWELTDPNKLYINLRNMLFEFTAFNGKFFRNDIFKRFGEFQARDAEGKLNRSNDREFLLRLAMGNIHSYVIPEALYVYLSHQGASSFSKKNLERIHKEHLRLADTLLSLSHVSSQDKILIKDWKARQFVFLFLTMIRQHHFIKAGVAMVDGLIKMPVRWCREIVSYTMNRALSKN